MRNIWIYREGPGIRGFICNRDFKVLWMICSGSLKLEATLTDKRQDKKIKDQEKEIDCLNMKIEKLQGVSEELEKIKEKMG